VNSSGRIVGISETERGCDSVRGHFPGCRYYVQLTCNRFENFPKARFGTTMRDAPPLFANDQAMATAELGEWVVGSATMRMSMRRFTRLTNAFRKKVQNHVAAISLHSMHYNFCRIHKTLRVTPAMEAGLTDHVWTLEEVALLLEAKNMEAKSKKRGSYKKKSA
jgi:hypothetical protein